MSKDLQYFVKENVLFISLCEEKSSMGDEDYQEGVVLYKDEKEHRKIVAIEVLNFTDFKENVIRVSDEQSIDFTSAFRQLRMLISLRDIMFEDQQQFLSICKEWGINVEIMNNKLHNSSEISVPLSADNVGSLSYTGC